MMTGAVYNGRRPQMQAAHDKAFYHLIDHKIDGKSVAESIVDKLFEQRPDMVDSEREANTCNTEEGARMRDFFAVVRHTIFLWIVTTCARVRDRFGLVDVNKGTKLELCNPAFTQHLMPLMHTCQYKYIKETVIRLEEEEIELGTLANKDSNQREFVMCMNRMEDTMISHCASKEAKEKRSECMALEKKLRDIMTSRPSNDQEDYVRYEYYRKGGDDLMMLKRKIEHDFEGDVCSARKQTEWIERLRALRGEGYSEQAAYQSPVRPDPMVGLARGTSALTLPILPNSSTTLAVQAPNVGTSVVHAQMAHPVQLCSDAPVVPPVVAKVVVPPPEHLQTVSKQHPCSPLVTSHDQRDSAYGSNLLSQFRESSKDDWTKKAVLIFESSKLSNYQSEGVVGVLRKYLTEILPLEKEATNWRSATYIGSFYAQKWTQLFQSYNPIMSRLVTVMEQRQVNIWQAAEYLETLRNGKFANVNDERAVVDMQVKKLFQMPASAFVELHVNKTLSNLPNDALLPGLSGVQPIAGATTRIIAFDPGWECGFALFQLDESECILSVDIGVIRVKHFDQIEARCANLQDQINPLLSPKPSHAFSESFFVSTKGKLNGVAASFKLRGAIGLMMFRSDIPFSEISSTDWKTLICTHGNKADDNEKREGVRQTCKADIPDRILMSGKMCNTASNIQHAVDAIGIGLYGIKQVTGSPPKFAGNFCIRSGIADEPRGQKRARS